MARHEYATESSSGRQRRGLPLVDDAADPGNTEAVLSRRTFLKLAGFAFGSAAVAGCQRPVEQQAIPYLTAPEGIVPGRTNQYAAICGGCSSGCGLLVQNRDGRPIKLEGNPDHPLSRGGLCAAGQASLLGLYDSLRLQQPLHKSEQPSWDEVDSAIRARLETIRKRGGAVRFLTGTLASPASRAMIQRFLSNFADARHVAHDTPSCSAIAEAHARTHGVRALPHYRLELAEAVVAFDADFLGSWIAPVEFASRYQSQRRLNGPVPHLSYHVQFESRLSLTGSKADQRISLAPGEMGLVLTHLANRVAKKAGVAWPAPNLDEPPVTPQFLDHLAEYLWQTRKRNLVLCGSQNVAEQVLCDYLNHLLGNYGTTVDLEHPSYQRAGSDRDLEELLRELQDGRVAALFLYQSNPVYDLPGGEALVENLRRVPMLVSCAERLDETAALAQYVCPVPHYLETWNDAEAVEGVIGLSQPVIQPLGNTRPLLASLAAWQGQPQSAYDLLRKHWETQVYPRRLWQGTFQAFWDNAVHDGFVRVQPRPAPDKPFDAAAVHPVRQDRRPAAEEYSLVLYTKVGMPNGSHAYNPWLQELPDPISKATWDNYACLSPAAAARLNVADGDVVRVETEGGRGPNVELPVLVQPGQHDAVVAVALGYGSRLSERFAAIGPRWLEARPVLGANGLVGGNASPLLSWEAGMLRHGRDSVHLTKTGRQHPLAVTQMYSQLELPPRFAPPGQERRQTIQEMTLAALVEAGQGESVNKQSAPDGQQRVDLWPADHPETGYRWGMAIDLNACTGCSACVIACQVENNIPVVGKDEVRRHREMHWLRLDRYYSERDGAVSVAHQPMLCQHCGNAPCEVVCPVLATVHSAEGINQQVYNRCVGTRYCANNCPYKVRRFNWFDYAHDDQLHNLVLNPEVTVRSRGVMEKCTFCVQRIEQARIEARWEGRELADGEIQTACQQSCPAQAIVFGDLNNPESRVSQLQRGRRAYRVLEELNVRPSISYLQLVRNQPEAERREPRE
jgi:molybdopterin-containing oxidoreductase family iron-sulfur binding subunit